MCCAMNGEMPALGLSIAQLASALPEVAREVFLSGWYRVKERLKKGRIRPTTGLEMDGESVIKS